MIVYAETANQLIEALPVGISSIFYNMGVRLAEDNIGNIRVLFDNRGHRLEHDLNPFAGAQQTESQYYLTTFQPQLDPEWASSGFSKRHIRNAVGNKGDFRLFNTIGIDE